MEEIWKDIDFLDRRYEVSNLGNVRSKNWNGTKKTKTLKQYENSCGYLQVHIHYGKLNRNILVHRIVAEVFVKNPANKKCVNHKDGNKQNNTANNLEWASHKENTRHALKTGLMIPNRGEKVGSSKLTRVEVDEIRQLYNSGACKIIYRLAKKYNVKTGTIYAIIRNKTWKS
jgi:hypothetical protein